MKSSIRWPTSLSAKAVTTAVLQAEAFAQAAGDVVFAAAFPGLELAGGADAAFAGIEAEHDFAEGDAGRTAHSESWDLMGRDMG